ncbi:MAG: hypothetical protein ABR955_04140 [Verrucomicrobiota bacterium]|jgi:hypothetical protein
MNNKPYGFLGGSAGVGTGAGTNGWPVSCWVIFAGGVVTTGCGVATNGFSVECSVRVMRSVFILTGTAFTINGSWDACSVPSMTLNSVVCLTALTTFFGLSLIHQGFFGFGFATNGLLEACSVFPTKRMPLGAVDLILVAGFVWLFFGGCI